MITQRIWLGTGDYPFRTPVDVVRADLGINYKRLDKTPFKWVEPRPHAYGTPCLAIDGPLFDLLESGLGMREGAFACRKCGHIETGTYLMGTEKELRRLGFCLNCEFWLKKAKLRHDPNMVVVAGQTYWITPDAPKGYGGFIGHGGALFVIRFLDGREIRSRNLWFTGGVPPHWRAFLPDNAVFAKHEPETLPGHDVFTGAEVPA